MVDREKKNDPPKKESFTSRQLCLFQDFLFNTPEERNSLSNTIELWDAVPKYYISKHSQNKLRKNGFLPTIEKNFVFRGQNLSVKVRPGRITVDGKDKEFYPGVREELVEDALRKMACNPGHGFFDNQRSGVSFTLHQLRKELCEQGHTFSYSQVIDSLKILTRSTVEITSKDGKSMYETSPLTSLAAVSKEDKKNNPAARWYVDFSLLVTQAIKKIEYRQYNYNLTMGLKGQLSRYLHKRISHNFIQASLLTPYTITMSSLSRDSGLLDCKRANDNKRKLEAALHELIEANVLMRYESDETRGERSSLDDIKYSLYPDHDFVAEQKRSNKRLKFAQETPL